MSRNRMKIKLSPSTQEAFLRIISTLGIDRVKNVFHAFLKNGRPILISKLAVLLDVSEDDALELAQNKGELSEQGELVGFLGLSLVPTSHKMLIDNKVFYAWCAADTLLFPAILNLNVEILSKDTLTNEPIKITVNNNFLTSVEPPEAMISWVDDVDDQNIRSSICNRVHFFASVESVNKWHHDNQDARIFTVEDFYAADIWNLPS